MFSKSIYTLVISCTLTVVLWAQPKDYSPLSRYGLGNFTDQAFASQLGMGGIRAAFNDSYETNFGNPASLAYLREASFSGGIFAKNTTFQSPSTSSKFWSGNLGYLSLAFPMRSRYNELLDRDKRKWYWGMGFSIAPYSVVGYDVEAALPNPDTSLPDSVNTDLIYNYQGRGGTYKILWGNAMRYKNISGGINLGYLFGKMSYERQVSFQNIDYAYDDLLLDEINVRGFLWNIGAQYDIALGKDADYKDNEAKRSHFIIGVYGGTNTNFKATKNFTYQRYNRDYGHNEVIDSTADEIKFDGTLPTQYGVGFMYKYQNHLRLGADFETTAWSAYKNEAKPESLSDTWRLSVGAEYTPDPTSYNDYFKRYRYRLGGYYGSDPRSINNDQFKTYGITAGFGIPLILPRQQTSFINLAFEYGKLYNNTFNENYFKINFGFTLNDGWWFYKRRFE